MARALRSILIIFTTLGLTILASETQAGCIVYKVRLSTEPLVGIPSLCLFELSSSGSNDEVHLSNYVTDARESSVVRTFGGPVEGRLAEPGSGLGTSLIRSQNGLLSGAVVSLDSLGNVIHFDVELAAPTDAAPHPCQFAFHLTGLTGVPFFPTADPSGAHALFSINETDSCEEVVAFAPCRFAGPDSIVLDASGIIGITGVPNNPPPLKQLRVIRAGPSPAQVAYTLEVEAPAGALVFRVIDIVGRVVHREQAEHGNDGMATFRWQLRADNGRRIAPGVYFVQVANARKSITRKLIIAR